VATPNGVICFRRDDPGCVVCGSRQAVVDGRQVRSTTESS